MNKIFLVLTSWLLMGAKENVAGEPVLLGAPKLSHVAGFYTNEFVLTVEGGRGGAVRYTLDGSGPTERSALYEGRIVVKDRTGTANRLSVIPTAPGFQRPRGNVFKGTVVRARTFFPDGSVSETATATYFVHSRGRLRYSPPVISLVTDAGNFFDAKRGIYVAGVARGGNYMQKGSGWERPVHVEFFETNGVVAFSQDAEIKIHGNTSPQFPIKGLDLDAGYGGRKGSFRHRIIPERNRREFDHILLRPSGHDHHLAFMRDELTQSLAEEFGAETQGARLAVVFLNGEYWGLHYLKEKENTTFISHYSGVAKDRIDYVEGYANARAGDTRHYEAMLSFMRGHDLAEPANYQRVGRMMDIDNYIDYKAAEIFNYRWDIGNHRLWRPRTETGRWRWLQFDNDVSWGGFWAQPEPWAFDMFEADTNPSRSLYGHNGEKETFLLRRLLESKIFRERFVTRFGELLGTVYSPERTVARIDRFAAALEPEMEEHIRRWGVPNSMREWRRNVEWLKEFAQRRPEEVRRQMRERFGAEF